VVGDVVAGDDVCVVVGAVMGGDVVVVVVEGLVVCEVVEVGSVVVEFGCRLDCTR